MDKIPVSKRALLQRINRKLAKDDHQVCKSRSWPDGNGGRRENGDLGEYHRIDFRSNTLKYTHVDIEQLGREIGALGAWEVVA